MMSKAIEYFIKEEFDKSVVWKPYKEFIHFGLTSQDINNTAFPLMLKDSLDKVYVPLLQEVIDAVNQRAEEWKISPCWRRRMDNLLHLLA